MLRTMHKRPSGYSLLEVMAVVAIIGVVSMLAFPAMNTFLLNARMTAAGNDFLTGVLAANAEAIKRRSTVTLCRAASPLADSADCTTGSGSWATGWIVFDDLDGDADVDTGEEILLRHGALGGTLTVETDTGLEDALTFSATGRLGVSGNLLFCDERGNVDASDAANDVSTARAVLLSATGRATLFRRKSYIDGITPEC
jgi:type IV fimbrial biogenesis protein FimT